MSLRSVLRSVLRPGAFAVLVASAFSLQGLAAGKHKHKSHGAHAHGHARLNLVVEGKTLTAVLEVSSESIYGFEYEPKTEKEKAQREAAGEKLKGSFASMLLLDTTLGCVFQNTKLNLRATEQGDHSETHAEFVATCQKPLAGSKATFAFGSVFPRVKRLQVQVISEAKQAGAVIQNDKGDVAL